MKNKLAFYIGLITAIVFACIIWFLINGDFEDNLLMQFIRVSVLYPTVIYTTVKLSSLVHNKLKD